MWVAAVVLSVNAQDWTPKAQVTGYVNAMAEWTDLSSMEEAGKEVGVGLAEAGFLASYRPIEKLELKTTLVYTHNMATFQDMLVEAYGKYSFNRGFEVSAGKFLTPLSPGNVYFFAPVNPSGIQPMLISHHFLTPQSISGLQLSGNFGEDFKAGYNLTYGYYTTLSHIKQGIIGLIGSEDQNTSIYGVHMENEKQNYDLGGSARVHATYKDFVSVGLNYFQGTRATQEFGYVSLADMSLTLTNEASRKHSYGVDFHLDYNGMIKFNGEYWQGTNTTMAAYPQPSSSLTTGELLSYKEEPVQAELKGYYGEVIFSYGWFSPYVRYEYSEDYKVFGNLTMPQPDGSNVVFDTGMADVKLTSIGAGMAIRPLYEVMLKLDYRRINSTPNSVMQDGIGLTPESYNHFVASVIISF